jgi:hypothetical protein
LLLKMIVAAGGDDVIVSENGVSVNGCVLPHSRQLAVDVAGRKLSRWPQGRYRLRSDQLWLYAANDQSWDSRYWGPAAAADVTAGAVPLFTAPRSTSGEPGCGVRTPPDRTLRRSMAFVFPRLRPCATARPQGGYRLGDLHQCQSVGTPESDHDCQEAKAMANDNGAARSKAKAGRGRLPQRRIDPLLFFRAWLATLRDCISNVPRQAGSPPEFGDCKAGLLDLGTEDGGSSLVLLIPEFDPFLHVSLARAVPSRFLPDPFLYYRNA